MRFQDDTVRQAFTETEERLQAMSLVYEALYRRDNVTCVDLKDYLEALVATLARAYGAEARGIRVDVDIQESSICVVKVVPLALAVNEAVTPSSTPSTTGAAFTVCWWPMMAAVSTATRPR